MNQTEQMKALADQIGKYVMKEYVGPALNKTVRFFRAEVSAAASDGLITVQRPFDDTPLPLPYTASAASLQVGDQCLVLVLGDLSNAVVFGDGQLSTN